MLVNLGGPPKAETLVGLLLECHERIRRFSRLAVELSRRADLPAGEVGDACARCERYFSEALPLHVADEEDSLLPRLRGHAVDAALATMHAQHEAHHPVLVELLTALRQLREAPSSAPCRARLGAVAQRAVTDFEQHLTLEEQVLFPVVAALPAEAQAQVVAELRARRRPGA